jgi:hypothetical protein
MSIGTGRCCVECQTYYAAKKNGVYVLETMEDGTTPYKIWMADLFECPDCGKQLVSGFGLHAISEHYMPKFSDWMKLVDITISGCPRSLLS